MTKFPVKFRLNVPGRSKLNLVKAIKFATGWGLKESKDFVDNSSQSNPGVFTMSMTTEELMQFRNDLSETDADYQLDDIQKIRERKIVKLGLGTREDAVNCLIDDNIDDIFSGGVSISKIENILRSIYNMVDDNKILNLLKDESNS